MLALIAVSGRGAVTMWGYPLWLFCGLWIVLFVPRPLDLARLSRVVVAWSAVFTALALAFIADYTVLPLDRSSLSRRVLSRRRAGGDADAALPCGDRRQNSCATWSARCGLPAISRITRRTSRMS